VALPFGDFAKPDLIISTTYDFETLFTVKLKSFIFFLTLCNLIILSEFIFISKTVFDWGLAHANLLKFIDYTTLINNHGLTPNTKYQFFNIIVYFKGDKVIIEWTLYIKITEGYTLQHGIEKIYYRLVKK